MLDKISGIQKIDRSAFDWILVARKANLVNPDCALQIKELKSWFAGLDKKYILIWLVPSVGYALIKIFNTLFISEHKNDLGAIFFAGGIVSCFIFLILFMTRKDRHFYKEKMKQNKGSEILFFSDFLAISSGEVLRGEANANRFNLSGLTSLIRKQDGDYFIIPFNACSHYEAKNHFFIFYPVDGAKLNLEVNLGSDDSELLTQLHEKLKGKIEMRAS